MRARDRVFVDTGAFVALAITRDEFAPRAQEALKSLQLDGARLVSSVAVLIETFTHLERRFPRHVALTWVGAVRRRTDLEVVDSSAAELAEAWSWLQRRDLHKLGIVDATSFVLMKKHKIRAAFTFDSHFAQAGFRIVG